MNIQELRIADIKIEDHPRKNHGDLEAHAKSIEAEDVLDSFNGSGSSTETMARLGVDGVGIDIDPAYCEFAVERLSRVAGSGQVVRLGRCAT